MLKTATAAMAGSAIGTTAGHVAANALNKETAEIPQEEVQQVEVTVLPTTEDITANDVHIEPEDEPIAPVYGGPGMVEPEDIEPIDIVVDMYGGPAMYDPEPLLDIETPNITDDILLSDVSDDLPDNIDTGNFDVCNDTYLV